MRLTEIVDPITNKDNPKALLNKTIGRKCHSFKSLRGVANFSRRHFHLVHTQKTAANAPRQKNICTKLHIGSHLLWLDLDTDVDTDDLRRRFKRSGVQGFFYYSSAIYWGIERRVRVCVLTKDSVPIEYQAKYYARQFLKQLGYRDDFINHLDTSTYNPAGYFAPVMYPDGTLVTDYDQHGKSLFIFGQGKPFKWIYQEAFQKELKQSPKPQTLKAKAQFGPLGDFARKLLTFKNIEAALARSNGTVTIIFKNIREKTKGGYYLNPAGDPWTIFHPNKGKTPLLYQHQIRKKGF